MPYSSIAGKSWIGSKIAAAGTVRRILDVGVGVGRYSSLFRERHPDAEWVGVEIWAPYVEQFGLAQKYDQLIISDVRWVDLARLGLFDVCFCGDVLEHMSASDAQQLVERLLPRCRLLFISIPLGFCPQGSVFDNPFERHVVEDYSDERIRDYFPAVVDGAVETRGAWTIGTYALSGDAETIAALHALRVDDRSEPPDAHAGQS
ncbi:class I SAM-dependent methyltransferase [Prosthecodimorpha staleyi]|uniref:Class I SAM-dependent methyltransferase n=1 Tax=Prosthecodimorpha staleyi TaxID=2840188 RepID=A0A947D2J4_9HYPH|nr:class I SAM-dependent methyltransferase [Prosthecodimorpha staleyi]MBT9289118.1 class I SAM-dependent methyltransferase [Prosthecodimorpha staleyi]